MQFPTLKACGSFLGGIYRCIKATPGWIWHNAIPILKPVSTAGWVAYPIKSFFQWVLKPAEGENVLDNPIAATFVTAGVLITFSLQMVMKYRNLKRKHVAKPKKEIQCGKNPLKWSVYFIFWANASIFYPGYCLSSALLSAEGWWGIFSTKPVDDTLLKLILFNLLGALIAYPAVKSSLTSNRNLIMYDYLPDVLDGTCLQTYSKTGACLALVSLGLGWPLTFSSSESTAISFNQNLLRHLSSKLLLGKKGIALYGYTTTIAVTLNNSITTPISLTDTTNLLLQQNQGRDYKAVVPECYDFRRFIIGGLCIFDANNNGVGVMAAMSNKWFSGNPHDPSTAVCVFGGFIIILCIIGTNVKYVLVERDALYAERVSPIEVAREQTTLLPPLADESKVASATSLPANLPFIPPGDLKKDTPLIPATSDVLATAVSGMPDIPQTITPAVGSPKIYTQNHSNPTLFAPLMPKVTESAPQNAQETPKKSRGCFADWCVVM